MSEDPEAVRACFTRDARIRLVHGDNPLREFYLSPEKGQDSYQSFYAFIWQNYRVDFGRLVHYIDVEKKRAAATFTPRLVPKPGAEPPVPGNLSLMNCNFFAFRGKKIKDMTIYYANPASGPGEGEKVTPTVPPRVPRSATARGAAALARTRKSRA